MPSGTASGWAAPSVARSVAGRADRLPHVRDGLQPEARAVHDRPRGSRAVGIDRRRHLRARPGPVGDLDTARGRRSHRALAAPAAAPSALRRRRDARRVRHGDGCPLVRVAARDPAPRIRQRRPCQPLRPARAGGGGPRLRGEPGVDRHPRQTRAFRSRDAQARQGSARQLRALPDASAAADLLEGLGRTSRGQFEGGSSRRSHRGSLVRP